MQVIQRHTDMAIREASTLVHMLRQRALQHPDKLAYGWIPEEVGEEIRLSYRELDRAARSLGAQLHQRGLHGQRVLLLYPPGLDYVAALYGCFYAGATAVPAYPPRPNRSLERIHGIVQDCQAALALTSKSVLQKVPQLLSDANLEVQAWAAEQGLMDSLSDWAPPEVDPQAAAFFQYTSGSTGDPKGVVVRHQHLKHNLQGIQQQFGILPEEVGISWLPMYHDMGLVGVVLQTVWAGVSTLMFSPYSFMQNPLRWLQAISHYRANLSGAPNFAFRLCVEKITPQQRKGLDLSCWRAAFCGAEPVHEGTMRDFAEAFAACGFRESAYYPGYGMAENTLLASMPHKPQGLITRKLDLDALSQDRIVLADEGTKSVTTLVGCGTPLPGQTVVTVDPKTQRLLPANAIGELWVSGGSVADGYWGREELTEQVFAAKLPEFPGKSFLRTGDMGFIDDERIFVSGRIKDMIILRGANHYPNDLEHTARESHPALTTAIGAAFSVSAQGQEQLVILQEVERRHYRSVNAEEVIEAVRQAIAEKHEIEVSVVVLVKPLTLPVTSSGKIKRRACRREYEAGTLRVLGQSREASQGQADEETQTLEQIAPEIAHRLASGADSLTVEEIEKLLAAQIARKVHRVPDEIDITEAFDRFGLDSLTAVALSSELEQWLGRKLSPTLFYDHPNIQALAQHLGQRQEIAVGHKGLEPAEPIAVVGMACRLPGGITTPEEYWSLLREGRSAISEIPSNRWDLEEFYDPDPQTPGKMSVRWGAFLKDIEYFDPQFFGVSPRELMSMDPQQRLLLEVAWEAMENAGLADEGQIRGANTGVFVGIGGTDYTKIPCQLENYYELIDAHSGTGNALSIASNRISFLFDLRGPSMSVGD